MASWHGNTFRIAESLRNESMLWINLPPVYQPIIKQFSFKKQLTIWFFFQVSSYLFHRRNRDTFMASYTDVGRLTSGHD